VTGALVYATSSFVAPLIVSAGVALVGGLTWLLGIRARPEAPAAPAAAGRGASAARPRLAFGNRRVAVGAAVAVLGGLSIAGLAVYPAVRATQATPTPLRDHRPAQGSPQALPGPDQPRLNPTPAPMPWAGPLDAPPPVGPTINVAPAAPAARPATANLHDVRPAGPTGYSTDDGDHSHDDGDDSGDNDGHDSDGNRHDDGHREHGHRRHDDAEHHHGGGHGGGHSGGHSGHGGGHHGGGHGGGHGR